MIANESMYTEERQKKILSLIKEKNRLSVRELSAFFNVSEVTIRNDFNKLAEEGSIIRTHGGALSQDDLKTELPVNLRKNKKMDVKRRIGKKASELISDGEVIFIDASTTAGEIAPFLKDKHEITAITNSLECAVSLARSTNVEIMILGGIVRKKSLSVVGGNTPMAKISKAFFGAWGFSIKDGLTDVNPMEIEVKKNIAKESIERIALVDSSKWGKVSYGTFMETGIISTIITDEQAPDDMVDELVSMNVKVIKV